LGGRGLLWSAAAREVQGVAQWNLEGCSPVGGDPGRVQALHGRLWSSPGGGHSTSAWSHTWWLLRAHEAGQGRAGCTCAGEGRQERTCTGQCKTKLCKTGQEFPGRTAMSGHGLINPV